MCRTSYLHFTGENGLREVKELPLCHTAKQETDLDTELGIQRLRRLNSSATCQRTLVRLACLTRERLFVNWVFMSSKWKCSRPQFFTPTLPLPTLASTSLDFAIVFSRLHSLTFPPCPPLGHQDKGGRSRSEARFALRAQRAGCITTTSGQPGVVGKMLAGRR